MSGTSVYVRRIATSAVLLSIALVLNTFFTVYIPLFGQNGMSVGISGIFSMLPAVLFGPVYGAAVSGLSDLMGYLLKPAGPYLPLLTLTSALGGFMRGWAYMRLNRKSSRNMRIVVLAFAVIMLIAGIASTLTLRADGVDSTFYQRVLPEEADTQPMRFISRLVIARTASAKDPSASLKTYLISVTTAPISCAAIALALLVADWFVSRRLFAEREKLGVLALTLAVILPGLIVTTINTVILRETLYASWKVLPFYVVWIPRVIEEILVGAVKAGFMAVLMGVFDSQPSLRRIVRP